jgi:hypothetical protein
VAEPLARTVRGRPLPRTATLDNCQLTEAGLQTPATTALRDHLARERAAAATRAYLPAAAHRQSDPRQAEFLRRARGLDTEQRLALIKEIFLPPRDTGGS